MSFFYDQVEVFCELHSGAIKACNKVEASDSDHDVSGAELFKNNDDRIFMMSMLLHCADISNAIKPLQISEKCVCNLTPKTQHLHGNRHILHKNTH